MLGWTKNLLAKCLKVIIGRPLRALGRTFVYKPFLKVYGVYILYLKRLRELGEQTNSKLAFLRKFLTPIGVIVTAAIIIYLQGHPQADKNSITHSSQAVLAGLVQNEFDSAAADTLTTETVDENWRPEAPVRHYLKEITVLKPELTALTTINPPESIADKPALTKDGDTLLRPLAALTSTMENGSGITPPAGPAKTNSAVIYTVKAGDSINRIASAFGIKASTILWENNLTDSSLIRQGQKLTILPEDGINYKIVSGDTLKKIAAKFKVNADDIAKSNDIDNGHLVIGKLIFVPGARRTTVASTNYPSSQSTNYNGVSAIKDIIKPANAKPTVGTKMNWPTVGYRITQYYSWRHTGLDIANKIGTPLYAAEAGTVEKAGWNNGGYGNMVLINHGGGRKTRYAHASKLYVKAGDVVEKGQTIAAMGSTGRSTGPHIHFEVIINGQRVNPLNYIR